MTDNSFDAYHKWLGIPAAEQPPNHYRLLSITPFEQDAEVIDNAASRQIAHLRTFALGPNSELSQKLLNEVASARSVLLDPTRKLEYDQALMQTSAPDEISSLSSDPDIRPAQERLPSKSVDQLPLAAIEHPPTTTGHRIDTGFTERKAETGSSWAKLLCLTTVLAAMAFLFVTVLREIQLNSQVVQTLSNASVDLGEPTNPRERLAGNKFVPEEEALPTPQKPRAASIETTDDVVPKQEPLAEASENGVAIEKSTRPFAMPPYDAAEAKRIQQAWSDYLGVPVRYKNSIRMNLNLIPAGSFMMGSSLSAEEMVQRFGLNVGAYTDELPQHRVTISDPYYIGSTEVTVGQFRQFVADTGYRTEAEGNGPPAHGFHVPTGRWEWNRKYSWKNVGFPQTDEYPVVNVTWNDAIAFCKWLSSNEGKSYGLPTEAQWEFACRSGTSTIFQTGDDPNQLARVGNVADATAHLKYPQWPNTSNQKDGHIVSAPVGSFAPNAFGLYDMHGNVWEWCQDWYGVYPGGSATDPAGPSFGTSRVIRGGCWNSAPLGSRSFGRHGGENPRSDRSDNNLGFRIVLIVE